MQKGGDMKKSLKNSLLVAGAVTTIGVSGLAGVSAASAQSGVGSDLVGKLASTFHLDKAKVQKMFDEDRASHEARHEKRMSERLQKLVDNGTITAAQKTAIEAKFQELQKEREGSHDEMDNLTESQRKAKMDKERADLESWAKSQGIDLAKLKGVFMRGFGGPGGPHHDE